MPEDYVARKIAVLEAKVDASRVSTLLIFYASWVIIVGATVVGLAWSLPSEERGNFAQYGAALQRLDEAMGKFDSAK